MIDIDNWMRELEEEEDIEIKNNEEYQTKLFEEYVLRGSDHQEERRKLNERYLSGEELMGEHGLRKELAAFDMSYFGRAYLPHYFMQAMGGACLTLCRESMMTSHRWKYSSVSVPRCPKGTILMPEAYRQR